MNRPYYETNGIYTDGKVEQNCSISEIEKANKAFTPLKGKKLVAILFNNDSGFRMIQYIVKGEKAKSQVQKGYNLAWVYNCNAPSCSEWGEIYIEKRIQFQPTEKEIYDNHTHEMCSDRQAQFEELNVVNPTKEQKAKMDKLVKSIL
jgi:hypothetical protein